MNDFLLRGGLIKKGNMSYVMIYKKLKEVKKWQERF